MSSDQGDSLYRSTRAGGSRSDVGASMSASSSRPFLAFLNPMSKGYDRLQGEPVPEEDEEDLDTPGAGASHWGQGVESHQLRITSPRSHPQQVPEDTAELTEPEEEDDDPHPSLMIERQDAATRSKSSRRSSHRDRGASKNSKRSQRTSAHFGADPPLGRLSKPPRPSEVDAREVISADAPGTSTAFATTRPKRGLDDYEKALWMWVNVTNLDAYLQEVYAYYTGKGIYCIALARGLNLLTVGFVIGFSTFLLGCVDYSRVHKDGTGRLSDLVIGRCVSQFSGLSFTLFVCFTLFYFIQVFEFIRGIIRLIDMYKFYTHLLGVPDGDIQTISWPEIVRRIGQIRDQNPATAISSNAHALDASELHHSNSPPTASLDAHDIANRIMRQENYLIALFNKDLLDFRVPLIPLLDTLVGKYVNRKNTLTRALEWNLRYCVLGHLFDSSGRVRKSFLREKNKSKEVELLRRRFIFMGLLNAVFAPFIVLYLLMYSFFRYFEEYHKNPSSIGGRQYTPYAEWKFREFNELPHIFRRRLNESYPVAGEYVDQFPKEKVSLIMRFVGFVAGSFAAVLALATVLDPDIFLHFEITPHRTVLFYLGLFGSVLAVARGMVPDSHRVFDPEMLMREVISHTHYMPTEWRGQLHSQMVQGEFGHLFEMRIVIFAQELLSVVLTPFVLWYSLPNNAPAIIDFFREFTVHIDGLGYVCSFAVFDFKRHGNVNFGAPAEVNDERLMSKEGKMEKSFLNFTAANPEWKPTDPSGSAFLSRMQDYSQNARLRRHRSRTERTLFGPQYASGPTFVHPNDIQFLSQQHHEIRRAENAALYERAMQKSTATARRRNPGPNQGTPASGARQGAASTAGIDGAESTTSHRIHTASPVGEIESELGDSYVHGAPTRGPRPEDFLEQEEVEDGGVMAMLTQIYGNQRRTVG